MRTTQPAAYCITLHVITRFHQRAHRMNAAGLAMMMEALDRADERGLTPDAIRDEFTEPLASRIIKAISGVRA